MRRLLFVAIVLAGAALLYVALEIREDDDSWTAVHERGILRVGMDASFPPFEVVDPDGEVRGLDVDLAQAVATGLDLRLEIVNIAFDGLYDALASGEVDVLVSALPYESQRTGDVRYSEPYFVDGLVWVLREGQMEPGVEYDGEVLAEAGSEAAMLVRHGWPDAGVVEVMSESDVMAGMVEGAPLGVVTHVSACVAGKDAGLVVGDHLTQVPYSAAVSAHSPALASMIMSTLEEILGSAEWTAIRQSWLGEAC